MGGSTAIASVIEKNEIGKAYDEYCKKILCNKQILSYIIKECIREFADIPLQEIPHYIESNPEFDVIVNDSIQGKNLEDESISGALIKYDILFEVSLPRKKGRNEHELIRVFVNLEAQNKDNPGYPLLSRAVYYCSRLLAKQKNAPDGFQHSKFDKIKKVYSIWICIQHAKEKDNVMNTYSMHEICRKRKWEAPKEEYDLMNAIMIYPGKDYPSTKAFEENHDFMEMLSILFIAKWKAEDKKARLKEKYGIIMTQEIEREVDYMCNLSQGIREEGLTEGLEKGVAKGRIDTTLCYVKRLIQKNNFSVTEAMDLLGVDEKIRPVILQQLQQQNK